uniref:Bromo domain-containing protein n=1 Tax=Kalanchoe fedtschenkoi TaxID=63787 RepID=A0A7N0RFX7_KALFE
MKRKRGSEKGKNKKNKAADLLVGRKEEVETVTVEDDSGGEEEGNDGDSNSGMDVDTPKSSGSDQAEKLSPEVVVEKPVERKVQVVYGRVRVKLKSVKLVESAPSSSGAVAVVESEGKSLQDKAKSSQEKITLQEDLKPKKPEVETVDLDENNDSSPDIKLSALGNPPKKSGGIKIKSLNRSVVSSSNVVSISPNVVEERTSPPKEQKVEKEEVKYDKQELDSALAVISKVMKMDAAEPFNAPVDPVALGIPDYFDVIDTPMDFGTICNNIRSGSKYKNSEDVFKDVQYIWDNCYKYNNKGDYIVDLMKRVKKNFTKYWQAAGLYSEPPLKNSGADSSHVGDGATPSQGKIHVKTGSAKTKSKKKPGFRRHKDGCLCAVCVLKRRRMEKDGKDLSPRVGDLTGTSESNMAIDSKQEGAFSLAESPFGGETSSNPDSQNPDSDAEMDGKAEEPERNKTDPQPISSNDRKLEKRAEMNIHEGFESLGDSQPGGGHDEHFGTYSQPQEVVEPASVTPAEDQKGSQMQVEEDPATVQQRKLQEAEAKRKRIQKLAESFNNPALLQLCGTLFPEDSKSIWCGPHSIVRKQKARTSTDSNSLLAAIESLLK